jgi:short-subunit dehydrogenase involved in D-alanine esterification of teichoic acids
LPSVAAEQPTHLRKNGVYLITGGLGVMGLKIAEHFARAAQAKLVLTSRYGLPAREEWAQWLASPDTDDKLRSRIESVQTIERLGAEVLVLQADVTDVEQMQDAMAEVYNRFGTLHGVIHAAGNSDPDAILAITETSSASSEAHFEARVHGLYALATVLQGRTLDFTLLVSSIAAVLGGLGFVAPSSAHLFMDAFAHQQTFLGETPWITVDFDQVSKEEAGVILEQVLALNTVQVVVSKQDLTERLQRLQQTGKVKTTEEGETHLHPRPNLHNPYVAPTNDLEELLADILQELLGIEQVGIHDNFFQLGGNSLLGTQVVSRIRNLLQVDLPLRVLFDANTVYDLGLIVEDILLRELEELEEEEAERLT